MFGIRKLDLLTAIYIFCIVTSESLGSKTIPLIDLSIYRPLFSDIPLISTITNILLIKLNTSVAILTVPLVFTINDMVTEVYGKQRTKSIIRAGLVVVVLVMIYSLIATNLPPSTRFEATEEAYDTIFGLSARFAFASLLAFAIAEFTDLFIFVKIRKALGSKALWFRNNASNFIAQLIDTIIFMFVAFWAFDKGFGDNVTFIVGLLIPYWLIKCLMSVIETPFVYLGVKWLKTNPDPQETMIQA